MKVIELLYLETNFEIACRTSKVYNFAKSNEDVILYEVLKWLKNDQFVSQKKKMLYDGRSHFKLYILSKHNKLWNSSAAIYP